MTCQVIIMSIYAISGVELFSTFGQCEYEGGQKNDEECVYYTMQQQVRPLTSPHLSPATLTSPQHSSPSHR